MDARRWAVSGGRALVVAGVLGAAAALFLVVVPPAVADDRFSYPLTPRGHAVLQVSFFVHHLLVVWGLLGVWRAGLAGRGALATVGGVAATSTMTALAVQELVAISAADSAYPSPQTDVIETVYGMLSLATGVGLLLLGVAVLRAHVLTGAGRFAPLVLGVFVFVPLTPAIFGPFVVGRLAIGTWLLLFAWLGVVAVRWAGARDGTPALAAGRPARSAPSGPAR